MLFITVALISAGVLISLYIIFIICKTFQKVYLFSKIPGPPGRSFIIGDVVFETKNSVTFFKRLRDWSKTCGPVYLLSASFLFPSVNISGPEAFEDIAATTKNIQKGQMYEFLHYWLGEGLLTSKGSKWHTRRKILTPAFHFSILKQFISVFNHETHRLVEQLKKEVDKPWTNVVPYISQFTLYSISETSMGTSLNLESTEDKNYVAAIYEIGKIFYYRLLRPWLYFNTTFYTIFPSGRRESWLVKTLHKFTNRIIAQRSSSFEKFEVPSSDDSSYFRKHRRLVFLDLLINAKVTNGAIDNQGIQDEVNTFMFEGHDTTAMSLCFTLLLLANNKGYQDQIYQEILTVLGDKINPDQNDLNKLKLMERFIKESLRLYPSVPFIARCLEEDTLIGGYVVPKNAPINIHIFDIHRNEKHWPDPEKFDPDRFLPENCLNRHPFAYVPFSAGPRNCIGQRFALLEMKAVITGIIRNFILEPIDTPESVQLVPDIVLRTAKETLKVKFSLRKIEKQ